MKPFLGRLINSEDDIEYKKRIAINSPVNGKVSALDNFPSQLYAQRLFGEGVTIELSGYQVLAPFDCIVEQLHPTAEQIRIKSAQGIRMQIQLGLQTENMMGNGFRLYAAPGQKLRCGEALLDFNLRKMKDNLKSSLAAITILNSNRLTGVRPHYRQVRANEDVLLDLYI